jgi:hypothetical protein
LNPELGFKKQAREWRFKGCQQIGRHPIAENLDDLAFEIPKRKSFAEFMRAKEDPISTWQKTDSKGPAEYFRIIR